MSPDTRDAEGKTVLMHAARAGQSDVVRLLVEGGAKLNLEDDQGRSALDFASAEPAGSAFQLLISSGAIYGSLRD